MVFVYQETRMQAIRHHGKNPLSQKSSGFSGTLSLLIFYGSGTLIRVESGVFVALGHNSTVKL
jgi:hypothetical protein